MIREHLLGLTPERIAEVCSQIGAPSYTANQILDWIYKRQATDFDGMTNISKKTRSDLSSRFEISPLTCVETFDSVDGTRKYVFKAAGADGYFESAVIPDGDRMTLCVSTQIGCRWNCTFCYTGKMGYGRDLEPREILGQYASIDETRAITNIVYMGMGDPMDAIDSTLRSLEVFTSERGGYGLGSRRITVSTVGVLPGLKRFCDESSCNLALSVHSPFSQARRKIMPVEARHPLAEVVAEIRRRREDRRRRISIEYVVFAGFNDSRRDVDGVAKLFHGLRCRINLIQFNRDDTAPSDDLIPAPAERIDEFRRLLLEKGFRVTVRKSRGNDIAAACGRLTTRRFTDS